MRGLRTCLLMALVLPVLGFAEEKKRRDPSMDPEVRDVIYKGDGRTVLIRLRLYDNGEPASKKWHEYMAKWFDYLDRTGNGYLNEEETQRAPNQVLLAQVARGLPYARAGLKGPAFEEFDDNGDKRISPAEFVQYYFNSEMGPLQTSVSTSGQSYSAATTQQILTALDANRDGQLNEAEANEAYKRLRQLDSDDDEVVALSELPRSTPVRRLGVGGQMPSMGNGRAQTTPLLLVPRERPGDVIEARLRFAKTLLVQFDKNEDNKLSREEIQLSAKKFTNLDRNKDDRVDALEMLRWLIVKPDLELAVHLDEEANAANGVKILTEDKTFLDSLNVEKTSHNEVTFRHEATQIFFTQVEGNSVSYVRSMRSTIENQFTAADPKKTGLISAKELADQRNYYLRLIVGVADRNLDGNLSREEVKEWLDLVDAARDTTTQIVFRAEGAGLFGALDANGDLRLSVRELKRTWQSLKQFDADADGKISREEYPERIRLVLGSPYAALAAANRYGQPTAVRSILTRRGPTWFTRMDRNGDGDVSQREFLGTPQQFREIDVDGDEVLSPEEAGKMTK